MSDGNCGKKVGVESEQEKSGRIGRKGGNRRRHRGKQRERNKVICTAPSPRP